ncbi:hypothetical protein AA14337_2967 [Acetobacter malorum DSM 14337]|uniref:Uncharacterized protein n=1 Tax=Acetobacter malorum DSM 14337 TaxID=1307910 RepID=A0ABQ0PYU8_9PROT|nr:hypothetical protein [Acetobacter malorum]GBQ84997.1 hypothetical protein AA14337_2967 [Acetobacter malorum DSM 14337]
MTPDIENGNTKKSTLIHLAHYLGVLASLAVACFCGDHTLIRFVSMCVAIVLVIVLFEGGVTKMVASDAWTSEKWDGLK